MPLSRNRRENLSQCNLLPVTPVVDLDEENQIYLSNDASKSKGCNVSKSGSVKEDQVSIPILSTSNGEESTPNDNQDVDGGDGVANDSLTLEEPLNEITTNLEEFVLRPGKQKITYKCRITRDKRGIEKGRFPTYYLHLERNNGKRIPQIFPEMEIVIVENSGKNILGLNGPRKMIIIAPGLTSNNERVEVQPRNETETIFEKWRKGNMQHLLQLENKPPVWNEDTQSYVLNFDGRVTLPSIKNFQIIHPSDENYIIMQFGRVSDDIFTMDFMYPFCALQAFCIAISSFDNKLACE